MLHRDAHTTRKTASGQNRRPVTSRWKNWSETGRQIKRLRADAALSLNQGDRAMENHQAPVAGKPARRSPWNKGKLVGAKPPLRPSHVWSIRTKLQMEGRKRDLALLQLGDR